MSTVEQIKVGRGVSLPLGDP